MRTTPHTQLRVPAEGRFLALVQGHVRDVARTVGFPAKDVLALELRPALPGSSRPWDWKTAPAIGSPTCTAFCI